MNLNVRNATINKKRDATLRYISLICNLLPPYIPPLF